MSSDLYRRLPAQNVFADINYLIQNGGKQTVTLRKQDTSLVRAVMSGKYTPFDTLEFLKVIYDYIPSNSKVRWSWDDEMTFHLSLTFPNTAVEIKKGDIVEQGIHLSNSEVGLRSTMIAGYAFNCICSNGAIAGGENDFFRFRHTGDSDRMRDNVKSAVERVMNDSSGIIAKFKDALNVMVEKPIDLLTKVFSDEGLTQDMLKATLNNYVTGARDNANNLYGVSQAINYTAHQFEGEQSFDLQRLAVKVLR